MASIVRTALVVRARKEARSASRIILVFVMRFTVIDIASCRNDVIRARPCSYLQKNMIKFHRLTKQFLRNMVADDFECCNK